MPRKKGWSLESDEEDPYDPPSEETGLVRPNNGKKQDLVPVGLPPRLQEFQDRIGNRRLTVDDFRDLSAELLLGVVSGEIPASRAAAAAPYLENMRLSMLGSGKVAIPVVLEGRTRVAPRDVMAERAGLNGAQVFLEVPDPGTGVGGIELVGQDGQPLQAARG